MRERLIGDEFLPTILALENGGLVSKISSLLHRQVHPVIGQDFLQLCNSLLLGRHKRKSGVTRFKSYFVDRPFDWDGIGLDEQNFE